MSLQAPTRNTQYRILFHFDHLEMLQTDVKGVAVFYLKRIHVELESHTQ